MTAAYQDGPLFTLRDECTELLDKYVSDEAAAASARAQADADPECPPLGPNDREALEAHWAKYGVQELYDQRHLSCSKIRGMTRGFFDMGPRTIEGAVAKFEFAQLLVEKVDECDLETWPHYDCWFADAVDELKRALRILARDKGKRMLRTVHVGPTDDQPNIDLIREIVNDLDDPIGQAVLCEQALNKLAELVVEDHVRASMFAIHTDLGADLITINRTLNRLHEATKQSADT